MFFSPHHASYCLCTIRSFYFARETKILATFTISIITTFFVAAAATTFASAQAPAITATDSTVLGTNARTLLYPDWTWTLVALSDTLLTAIVVWLLIRVLDGLLGSPKPLDFVWLEVRFFVSRIDWTSICEEGKTKILSISRSNLRCALALKWMTST